MKIKLDTKAIDKYLDRFYVPGDSEAGTLNNKVYGLYKKVQEGKQLAPAEAFLGRSMAAAMKRTDRAGRNPSFRKFADEAQNKFDDILVDSGMPEIKQLSTRYFAAVARDHLESILPRNKNMSPNALRGVLMFKQAIDSIGAAANRDMVGAVKNAGGALAMSPAVIGQAIGALNPPAAPILAGGATAAIAYRRNKKQNK